MKHGKISPSFLLSRDMAALAVGEEPPKSPADLNCLPGAALPATGLLPTTVGGFFRPNLPAFSPPEAAAMNGSKIFRLILFSAENGNVRRG
jgi:hypothetical protein